MSDALLRAVAARFDTFTAPYLDAPGDTFAYRIKVEHTRHVLAVAEAIIEAERLTGRTAQAGKLGALLHDVGRFPQFRQYRTFRDAESANHARLSVRHILRENMLEGIPADIRRLTLGAVFLHNKRTMPHVPSAELRAVAGVVRDSDKLDIYRIMIDHFASLSPKDQDVVLRVKDEPGIYSPHVLATLLQRGGGNYQDLVYVNDFKLILIGWLYDLNFPASYRMLADRGYVETIFATLPKDARIDAFRKQALADLAERLKGA
jgi:HD domain.